MKKKRFVDDDYDYRRITEDDNCSCVYCRYTSMASRHSAWSSGCKTCGGMTDDLIGLLKWSKNPHKGESRAGDGEYEDQGIADAYGSMTRLRYLNAGIPACAEAGCIAVRDTFQYVLQENFMLGFYERDDTFDLSLDGYMEVLDGRFTTEFWDGAHLMY